MHSARLGRRIVTTVAAGTLVLAILLAAWGMLGRRDQDPPWGPLDLGAPVGLSTGRRLTALGSDFGACRAALDRAGVRYVALPPRRGAGRCGYADGIRFAAGGTRGIALLPAGPALACPVAAALAAWEWNVVQPAALAAFATPVVAIDHLGSYNCRRLYGRDAGAWSEHAGADAIDIAGFRLADGRRITVARDWRGSGPEAIFLRRLRDGACTLFATTLSPDYNAAHRDHLHLDQAARGATGWRACR